MKDRVQNRQRKKDNMEEIKTIKGEENFKRE